MVADIKYVVDKVNKEIELYNCEKAIEAIMKVNHNTDPNITTNDFCMILNLSLEKMQDDRTLLVFCMYYEHMLFDVKYMKIDFDDLNNYDYTMHNHKKFPIKLFYANFIKIFFWRNFNGFFKDADSICTMMLVNGNGDPILTPKKINYSRIEFFWGDYDLTKRINVSPYITI